MDLSNLNKNIYARNKITQPSASPPYQQPLTGLCDIYRTKAKASIEDQQAPNIVWMCWFIAGRIQLTEWDSACSP